MLWRRFVDNQIVNVDIGKITIPSGRRPLKDTRSLAQSIEEVGLLNPITLTEKRVLVAGLHRLYAARALGWKRIPARLVKLDSLHAKLAEIDENLFRNELTVLERGEQLAERKEIYEALHPETKPGKSQVRAMHKARGIDVNESNSPTFTANTAGITNESIRTIEQHVQIATSIPDDVKEKIRDTDVANSKTDLLALARLKKQPEKQLAVAEEIATGKAGSVKDAEANIKRDAKEAVAEKLRAEPPPVPTGPHRVIVMDPPWRYESRAADPTHRAANPYPDMSLDEIRALPVVDLAHDDCVLWLWTTNAFLRDAFTLLDAWGFTSKTILTWVKDRMGTGDWLRGKTEHCILAVRGRPTVMLTNQTTALVAPMREHSRKPDEFYALVDALCPGSKLEMFARESREGWQRWGAESEKFNAA
jgi:N6-adenosine-specific RNA methylase IME4